MPIHAALVRTISHSKILADYESAFSAVSGLPLRFQPADTSSNASEASLPLRDHPAENPFCALISKSAAGCKMCLQMDHKIRDTTGESPRTEVCIAGLSDTAIPVIVQGRLAGHLRTGQVALQKNDGLGFSKIARVLVDWGVNTDLTKVEEAWFHSKVLAPAQYEAFIQLLSVFARHLGMAAEMPQVVTPTGTTVPDEAPIVQKTLEYIQTHNHDNVSVQDVARTLNLSVFYFCKVFKKATNMTFTEYLANVRTAKAKNLLLNPHARISEIAFESGFQSITHFNRVFRKLSGQSPSAYREAIQRKTVETEPMPN